MDDNQIKLVLDLLGTESIDKAVQKLQQLRGSMQETYAVEGKLGEGFALASGQIDEALDKEVASAVEATMARKALAQALEEDEAALKTTTTSTANMGRGILQTSFAVQDFTSVLSGGGGLTRALGSVQNNIPILLTSLGVGAGLAGTISLVSVGIGAAIPLLEQFAGADEKAAEAAKKAADEVKRQADEVERLRKLRTPEQDETKAIVEKALASAPSETVLSGIRAGIMSDLQPQLEKLSADMQVAIDRGQNSEARRLEAEGVRLRKDAESEIARVYSTLGTDPSSRSVVLGLAGRRPDNFPTSFIDTLFKVSPEGRERERQLKQITDDEDRFNKEQSEAGMKARKEAEDLKRRREESARRGAEFMRNQDSTAAEKDKADTERIVEDAERTGQQMAEDVRRMNEREARQGQRDARQAARDADPDTQLRRERDRVHDETANAVMGMWNAGGRVESPEDVRQFIADAERARQMPGVSLADAIQQAMAARDQRWAEWLNDQQRQLLQMQMSQQSMMSRTPSFLPWVH